MPSLFECQHFAELTESDRDIILAGISKGIGEHQFIRVSQAKNGNICIDYKSRCDYNSSNYVSPHHIETIVTGTCGGLSIDEAETIVLDALKLGIDASALRDHLERYGIDVIYTNHKGYVWFVVSRWDSGNRHCSNKGKPHGEFRWSAIRWVLDFSVNIDGDRLRKEPIYMIRR